MAINKQPIFTAIPILAKDTIDPPIINGNTWRLDDLPPASIFTATDDYGTLIERITISSTGDLSNTTVTAKLVYLCIYSDNKLNQSWNMYKVAAIPATTVSATTPPPQIEWVFTGGLLLPDGYQLGLAATTNHDTTSEQGDFLTYVVEGSTYTQPA
jgi:hypothetical protein